MKKYYFLLVIIALATSCEKDGNTKPEHISTSTITDCRGCGGSWDITDTIP